MGLFQGRAEAETSALKRLRNVTRGQGGKHSAVALAYMTWQAMKVDQPHRAAEIDAEIAALSLSTVERTAADAELSGAGIEV